MPQKNLPPNDIAYFLSLILTGLAGACGALVGQIHGPKRPLSQRILEWLGGALCAIYGAELLAFALYHSLEKLEIINTNTMIPEKIFGLAGFLCGAMGITIIDIIIDNIHKHLNKDNY